MLRPSLWTTPVAFALTPSVYHHVSTNPFPEPPSWSSIFLARLTGRYALSTAQHTSSANRRDTLSNSRDVAKYVPKSCQYDVGGNLAEEDIGQVGSAGILRVEGRDQSCVATSYKSSELAYFIEG